MPESETRDNRHAGRLTGWLHDSMTEWRHTLHSHPETAFEEVRTSAFVAERLRDMGLEVHTGIGRTGVVGVLRNGGSTRAIGLRADMDALNIRERNGVAWASRLDGKMHACGHDGHTTMLLGAAAHLAKTKHFDGTAVFIFQPAEENGLGAPAMIADGLFERFPMDEVYGLHNAPLQPLGDFRMRNGPTMSNEDIFIIRVTGRGGHASAPHVTRDPLPAGAEIVTALQTIVSRGLDPNGFGVVSVTEFLTDGTRNVIPNEVTLKGDARSFTDAVRAEIESRMRRIVAGVCAAHGLEGTVEYRHEFVATVNSAREVAEAAAAAADVVGLDRVDANCPPSTGSEDFAHMLRRRPGAYIFLGCGRGDGSDVSVHNPHYDFNDEALTIGADYWVRLIERRLASAI